MINFQREPHSFQWVRKGVSRPQQSILRGDYRGLTVRQLGGFHRKITQPYWGRGETRKFYRPPLMNNDQSLPSVRAVYGKQQSSVLRILPVSKSHEQLYVKY